MLSPQVFDADTPLQQQKAAVTATHLALCSGRQDTRSTEVSLAE